MITKTANDYLLKEALSLQDVQDAVAAIPEKIKDLNDRRIAAGYTAGNLLSKLPVGSDENKDELRTNGAIAFLRNHGGKRLAELDALKDAIVEKAKIGAGHAKRFADDVGRGYKDLYNYATDANFRDSLKGYMPWDK